MVFKLLFLLKLLLVALLFCLHLLLHQSSFRILLTLLNHRRSHFLNDILFVLPFRRFEPHADDWLEVDVLLVDVRETLLNLRIVENLREHDHALCHRSLCSER